MGERGFENMLLKKKQINFFFDLSFALYLIAYIFYYDETYAIGGKIRLLSTFSLLLFGLIELYYKKFIIVKNKSIVWYLAFASFCAMSSLWAAKPALALSSLQVMIRILLVFFFLTIRIDNEIDVEHILNAFMIGVTTIILLTLKEMIAYHSDFWFYRFGIVGNNPNTIAILSTICIIIFLHRYQNFERNRKLQIALCIPFAVIIVLTQSKKGILALLIGAFLTRYFSSSKTKKLNRIFGFILLLIVSYELIMTIPFLYEGIGSRLEEVFDLFGGTSSGTNSTIKRAELIKEGFRMWKENPILGVGINNFSVHQNVLAGQAYYSHCNYIELLSGVGIVGFLIYYLFPFWLITRKTDEKDSLSICLRVICIVIMFMDVAFVSFQTVYFLIFFCVYMRYLDIMIKTKHLEE